ncbi:MAG: hypothetical protein Q9181_003573 [Wetmoreana brouardii]
MRQNATSYFPLRQGVLVKYMTENVLKESMQICIITDYDRKNFTVAQAVHNDTATPNIFLIPWNATATLHTSKPVSQQATICISTGSAFFVLLIIILAIFLTLRWRRRRAMTVANVEESHEARPFPYLPTQEISHQSVPELHDAGYQLELLDELTPSGSGNVLIELPDVITSENKEEEQLDKSTTFKASYEDTDQR